MRNLWSKVLIDGLMKDYESKKRLAVLFTSNYPTIVNNFITDDQVMCNVHEYIKNKKRYKFTYLSMK